MNENGYELRTGDEGNFVFDGALLFTDDDGCVLHFRSVKAVDRFIERLIAMTVASLKER